MSMPNLVALSQLWPYTRSWAWVIFKTQPNRKILDPTKSLKPSPDPTQPVIDTRHGKFMIDNLCDNYTADT